MFITVVTRAISLPFTHSNPLQTLSLVLYRPFTIISPSICRSKGHYPLALYAFMCTCFELNVYGHVLLQRVLVYNYWVHTEHNGLQYQWERGPNPFFATLQGPLPSRVFFLFYQVWTNAAYPVSYLADPGRCFHRGKSAEAWSWPP
jgi:hypothetical protein